jgi:ankyrin repeat protein
MYQVRLPVMSLKDINNIPLHKELKNRVPSIQVIREILQEFPDSAKTQFHDGELPLHVALERNCTVDILRVLIDAYPTALEVRSRRYGENLPLHVACKNNHSVDVISLLIEK